MENRDSPPLPQIPILFNPGLRLPTSLVIEGQERRPRPLGLRLGSRAGGAAGSRSSVLAVPVTCAQGAHLGIPACGLMALKLVVTPVSKHPQDQAPRQSKTRQLKKFS